MTVSVTLPALGESVSEGTVTRWLKQVGDTVEADEPLLEISTDKVDTEIPSPASGVLVSISVPEDETVEVGGELAVIGEDTGAATSQPAPAAAPTAAEVPSAEGTSGSVGSDVVLPALGESVSEGTVTRWLKQVGDTVEADEPLLEISTDKVDTEIPSPVSGVLLEILVAEDETAEVGARLAVVGGPTATPAVQTAPAVPSPAVGAPPGPAAASTGQPSAPRIPAPSPAAPASGGSRAEDAHQTAPVRKAVAEPEVAPAPPAAVTQTPRETPPEVSSLRGQTVRMSRIRKIIGDNMVKALHEQAQLTTVVEADVTRLMQLRARAKDAFAAREGFGLSPFPFFVRAAAQALKAHPAINARINEDEGTITYFDTENIGIAVDTEKGLMTPVIKGAGDLDVGGIARAIVELAGKARGGGLTPDDVTGATFTISNTGSRGALFDTVVVPPNQAAILGVGAMAKRPSVVETADGPVIAIRDLVHLSLSYDHRLIDGADAARYLTALKALVEAAAFTNDLLTE